jgi:hypothetical protein
LPFLPIPLRFTVPLSFSRRKKKSLKNFPYFLIFFGNASNDKSALAFSFSLPQKHTQDKQQQQRQQKEVEEEM